MDQQEIKELQQRIETLEIENEKLKKQLYIQEETNSSEAQFRKEYASKIFESLPDMVTIFTYDGVLRHLISSEESNHAGAPLEQILNQPLINILSPEAARIVHDNIQKVKARKKTYTGHHTIEIDGVINHYEHRIVPLDDKYVIIYCRDVTNQVQQAKRNKDLKDLLDNILNNLPLYLFVKDVQADMKYIYWNNAFAEASGIPASQAIGRTDYEVFPNIADANKFRKDDTELLLHKTPIAYEEEYTTDCGDIKIVSTRKVLCKLSENKEVIIGVSIDISEMKNIEQELLQAKQKAEENDKQKSVFLSNMGHEIRTPVNAIVGFADALTTVETPEEQKQCLDVIKLNSNLLLQLISDILDLSKIEAGTLEFINKEINLGSICSNIHEMHQSITLFQDVKLIYENKGQDFPMIGDANRIMQVINNFLTNAIKFTHEGEIRFGFHKTGPNEVYIYVTDSGLGIPEEKKALLFDRFVKLHPEINGTGLGLAICKTIVAKLGGEIGVTSTLGKGSHFYFTIPIIPNKRT